MDGAARQLAGLRMPPGLRTSSSAAFGSVAQSGAAALKASRSLAVENRALTIALGTSLAMLALWPALAHIWVIYELPTALAVAISWV